ncbi:MAG: ACT domain-containing protein [Firmicutes bacterium]|nr:ACT domain-containing protein [Bacillota bacterium]
MTGESSSRIIVTVLGCDRVGIIAGVANVLAEANANILDISQTILQEFFVMIMIVDMARCTVDLSTLKERLTAKGEELGVRITAQHEDVFRFMHRI